MSLCDSCDRPAVSKISRYYVCEYLECEMFVSELLERE